MLQRLYMEQMLRPPSDPEAERERLEREVEREVQKVSALEKLAVQNFGIHRDMGDGEFTMHPVMAGIIRRALSEAFDAGIAQTASMILTTMLARRPTQPEKKDPDA